MASFRLNMARIKGCPPAKELVKAMEAYGLPEDPKYPVMSTVQQILQPAGQLAFAATVVATITAWIIARRNVRMEVVE